MKFTASSFERARRCPGSAVLPQANTASEWSDTGNEGHGVLGKFIDAVRCGHEYVPPSEWWPLCEALVPIAAGLRSEVAFAYNLITGAGRILGYDIDRAYKQAGCTEEEIPGSADLAGCTETHAIIIDLKTGWGEVAPAAHNRQLRLLALAACGAFGRQAAKVAILRCHEGGDPFWDWAELDALDLADTQEEVLEAANRVVEVRLAGRVPDVAEGSWCKYCPAAAACPAKNSLALVIAEGRLLDGVEAILPFTPERAGMVYDRIQAAKAVLKIAERAVYACLNENGSLPLPGGRELRKVIVPGNEKLDGERAYEFLRQVMGEDVADNSAERKVTKTRLREALSRLLGRGGAAKERELLEVMRQEGICTRGTTEKTEEVPAGEARRLAR